MIFSAKYYQYRYHIVGVFLILAALFSSLYLGLKQFPGYDASPMVNEAYRLFLGQQRSVDYFSPFPPLFSWISSVAFQLFGPNWFALAAIGAITTTATCTAIFAQLRNLIGVRISFLVAVYSFTATGLFVGFWWHGTITTLLAVLYLGVLLEFENDQLPRTSHIKLLLVGASLILLKPNIAFPTLLGGLCWLSLPSRLGGAGSMKSAALHLMAAVSLAAAFCLLIIDINPVSYVRDIVEISTKRAATFPIFADSTITPELWKTGGTGAALLILPVAVMLASSWFKAGTEIFLNHLFSPRFRSISMLTALCLVIGITGVFTNGDFPVTSFPLILLGLAILPISKQSIHARPLGMLITGIWLIAALHTSLMGVFRDRIRGAGQDQFWESPALLTRVDQGFFQYSETGPILLQFERESRQAIQKWHPQRVFFGPRVEFGYAAFELVPPLQMPLWFDPQSAWLPCQNSDLTWEWLKADFEMAIFHRDDMFSIPPGIIFYLKENYRRVSDENGSSEASIWVKQ